MNRRERWVRWYTADGKLIPSQQEQRAEAEARAARLAEQLAAYEQRFGPLQGR